MIDPELIARVQEYSESTEPVTQEQLRAAVADMTELTSQCAEATGKLAERSGSFDMGDLSVSVD